MSFKVTLGESISVQKVDSSPLALKYLEDYEVSEWIMEAFDWPKMNSDYWLTWSDRKLKSDIYELSSSLDEWLVFVAWLQKGQAGQKRITPWTSSFEMCFDASLDTNHFVTMCLTEGAFFADPDITNMITVHSSIVIKEMSKLFVVCQFGLASIGKGYYYLDRALDEAISDGC